VIVDSVLTNAKVYLKGEIAECSLAVEEGVIQKIGKEPHMPRADERTDLQGLLVLPGVVDCHVHLRDEERAYKETFQTGTAAAAAGGVTTVLDMPNNSPTTMSIEALRNRMNLAKRRIMVNVGFLSEFPATQDEIDGIAAQGAVGFKLFLAEQVGGIDITDDAALKAAFEHSANLNVPVAVHAEDHALLKKSIERMKLANRHDMAAFLKAHDEVAEQIAVERVLRIAGLVKKMRLHFCHVSTKGTLEAIGKAKVSKKAATCEVTPHHLLLTKDDYTRLGARALTMPPLRTEENVQALWKGVDEGKVDTIGSDHAPHALGEKDSASIWDVKAGIPGLETTLPLTLTMVHKEKLTLEHAVELLSQKPAEVFSLDDRGRIEEGKAADFAVVDFNQKFRIDASAFKSKAKFSPFDKWEVQGKPIKTYVSGVLVMDESEIAAKFGTGSVIVRRA
jgi:dihydroorotase (multifunctional complex type)